MSHRDRSLVELEVKFAIPENGEPSFVKQAIFQDKQTFTDTYLDDPYYSLTTNNKWLRKRNNRFEFKAPLHGPTNKGVTVTRYHEHTDEEKIRSLLQIDSASTLENDLKRHGYRPCASFTTKRTVYRLEGITLVLDDTDFGYRIGEAEIVVDRQSDAPPAREKLETFLSTHGLPHKPPRTKVQEFIRRHNPDHYHRLRSAGI